MCVYLQYLILSLGVLPVFTCTFWERLAVFILVNTNANVVYQHSFLGYNVP